MIGALTRVVYLNKYRICKIKSVYDLPSEYMIENPANNKSLSENERAKAKPVMTKFELVCQQGVSLKNFKMSLVSN